MSYLISQTFILLLIAALLGMLLGTFLTRITAATSRAALQARLRNAETDARELRAELDVAVTARGACEAAWRRCPWELLLGDVLRRAARPSLEVPSGA